ncbi:hypothetical protein HYALB_00012812 [Hymenoscyphus albidus]|uniref:glucan 1,4-alpha-glucosidase n=1 Tax=Hymenoscyphus albidus TaxID=595503 RepID=A0A9N9LWU8_9HELO|nr:hypothetical protein HYALB_00012812 [Hymenoscyphus albidus]
MIRNETGFDLWEEVQGSSFFTIAAQHRSLIEGSALAAQLGKSCPNCDSQAPQVLCFLQTLWNPSQNYMVSNINYGGNYRNGRDANTILASIHMFDPAAKCDSLTFQPCSDRALANHKAVTDSFRTVYAINAGIPQGTAVAVGRYSEDVYFGGNPWYLTTLAAAEQLYAALYTWQQEGSITVTSVSLPFFRDLSSSIAVGTYASSTSEYTTLINAVKTYADGYIAVIERYAEPDGSMAEQFSRNTGLPLSAYDLTWSYAAFLTAAARRAGEVPESWVNAAATVLPNQCSRTSANGPYAVAPTSPFPANQTPIRGVPPPTTTRPPCTIATAVSVTFRTSVTTQFGQTIKIVGSVAQLGNWDPASAITLSAREYTDTNNVWVGEVTLPAGAAITYKYINVASDGAVTWERDPNHSFTVPRTCATAATVNDSFQRQ